MDKVEKIKHQINLALFAIFIRHPEEPLRGDEGSEILRFAQNDVITETTTNHAGFLLMEALVSIAILSIALLVGLSAMGQALYVAKKTEELTEMIVSSEDLLFTLETGSRTDLIFYGGKGKVQANDSLYEIKSEEFREELETKKLEEKEPGDNLPKDVLVFQQLEIKVSKQAATGIHYRLLLPQVVPES